MRRCPHCGYEDEVIKEERIIENYYGQFFRLRCGEMERPVNHGYGEFHERVEVLGCPKCQKLFMEH